MNHIFIIPTYGRADLVRACIESFYKVEPWAAHARLLVVDDDSPPSEFKALDVLRHELGFQLIKNNSNGGFSSTVNAGLAYVKDHIYDIYTLVNNDIVFTHPVMEVIESNFAANDKLGVLGAKLLYPTGAIQHAGVHYLRSNRGFVHTYKNTSSDFAQANVPKFVEAVTGALFSIGRKALQKLGPLSNAFFVACEDTDYCLRAWGSGFQVYYDPAYTAIHLEGATRGVTLTEKKKINYAWHKREIESIRAFQKNFSKYQIDKVTRTVMALNKRPPTKKPRYAKLEIGSGHNPQPGYVHLDVRKGLPQLDYVCDFSKDKLPFDANTFTDILANHVIEHVSWRVLPHVLKEWYRVLKTGGRLVIRTPDLKFICETYLKNRTTPEHPDDEGYIKTHLSHTITPAWWANIKLFAGQDYPSNFHNLCFDFDMLRNLLEKFWFKDVALLDLKPVFSPGELQVEAYKR